MQTVYIIYRRFFDNKGNQLTIGGIQSYINQLIEVLSKKGLNPVIVQFADKSFEKEYHNALVYGINVKDKKNELDKAKVVLNFIKKRFKPNDFIIFATEDFATHTFTKRTLAIQHGIGWDKPLKRKYVNSTLLSFCRKAKTNLSRLNRIKHLNNIVCVDYNYLNWLRTQQLKVDKNIYVIPNSSEIYMDDITKDDKEINIIFARRFVQYRGTRLFSKAVEKILKEFDHVNVTFAGEGEEEEYLKKRFKSMNRVKFITYKSDDSLEVHKTHHIAVIPTLGSEGTSLSLLEAMATKCAVISTNVGGMTNIVLDHFNGLMINPKEEELYHAIKTLILDEKLRMEIAENGYITVSKAFNRELWNRRWNKVINELVLK